MGNDGVYLDLREPRQLGGQGNFVICERVLYSNQLSVSDTPLMLGDDSVGCLRRCGLAAIEVYRAAGGRKTAIKREGKESSIFLEQYQLLSCYVLLVELSNGT